jgi:hypothetical protein
MSRFTLVWDAQVEVPFTDAWLAGNSQTRAALTEIANWIDSTLTRNPTSAGETRPELEGRVVHVPFASSGARVSVTYQVLVADRIVRVT